jgi:hypothetical protein
VRDAPSAQVRCALSLAPKSEAEADRFVVLGADKSSRSVDVVGVADFVDDGPQRFDVSLGPCESADRRFKFGFSMIVASGWNEDYPYPQVTSITPAVSAMIGEAVTLTGKHLHHETQVCVNGLDVSEKPTFRVSLAAPSENGLLVQREIELKSDHAILWFETVTGSKYRYAAKSSCAPMNIAQPSRRRQGADTLASTAEVEPRAAGNASATNGTVSRNRNQTGVVLKSGTLTIGNVQFNYTELAPVPTGFFPSQLSVAQLNVSEDITLYLDYVQRYNFSFLPEDGIITFITPVSFNLEEHYAPILLRDQEGAQTTELLRLFYTEKCPQTGWYGSGFECSPCPENAKCPGGKRVWPNPGYWNRGEWDGVIVECVPPADRCVGVDPTASPPLPLITDTCDDNTDQATCYVRHSQEQIFLSGGILANNGCGFHFAGLHCDKCTPGYFAQKGGRFCSKCDPQLKNYMCGLVSSCSPRPICGAARDMLR